MGAFERSNLRGLRNGQHPAAEVDYPNELGQKMQQLRKQRGLTQRVFAEKLGISTPALCRWESGQAFPRWAHVQAFANAFNLSESELVSMARATANIAAGPSFAEELPARRASDDVHGKQKDPLRRLLASCKQQIADVAGTKPERAKFSSKFDYGTCKICPL